MITIILNSALTTAALIALFLSNYVRPRCSALSACSFIVAAFTQLFKWGMLQAGIYSYKMFPLESTHFYLNVIISVLLFGFLLLFVREIVNILKRDEVRQALAKSKDKLKA